jgi:hypothetical protein
MSDGALTCLFGILDTILLAWVPVALLTGKRSGASVTILVEALIILAIIIFELIRRVQTQRTQV